MVGATVVPVYHRCTIRYIR